MVGRIFVSAWPAFGHTEIFMFIRAVNNSATAPPHSSAKVRLLLSDPVCYGSSSVSLSVPRVKRGVPLATMQEQTCRQMHVSALTEMRTSKEVATKVLVQNLSRRANLAP